MKPKFHDFSNRLAKYFSFIILLSSFFVFFFCKWTAKMWKMIFYQIRTVYFYWKFEFVKPMNIRRLWGRCSNSNSFSWNHKIWQSICGERARIFRKITFWIATFGKMAIFYMKLKLNRGTSGGKAEKWYVFRRFWKYNDINIMRRILLELI